MTDSSGLLSGGPIVVGIEPGLPPSIVAAAEQLGLAFDCEVLFAYVELNSALVELDSARTRTASSLKPEMDEEMTGIAAELAGYLKSTLDGSGARWAFHVLAGDPASALSRLAATTDARMFVVGTRRHGAMRRLEEFVSGSIAKELAMGQERPVLLVPMSDR
ncbi:MAG TPA: universal stress protein [Microterricola sp.]